MLSNIHHSYIQTEKLHKKGNVKCNRVNVVKATLMGSSSLQDGVSCWVNSIRGRKRELAQVQIPHPYAIFDHNEEFQYFSWTKIISKLRFRIYSTITIIACIELTHQRLTHIPLEDSNEQRFKILIRDWKETYIQEL